jgi:rubredoxin
MKKNEKFTFDFVKKFISENGCELLETEYLGSRVSMRIKHESCGNIFTTSFSNFKFGRKCHACSTAKPTFKYVKQYFIDQGCTLLETEYKDVRTLMRYLCVCGEENTTRFQNFKQGTRCRKCGAKKKKEFLLPI